MVFILSSNKLSPALIWGWRKLHNEDIHNLCYYWGDQTKDDWMDWTGHLTRTGEIRNQYNISVGKPEGKRLLGRTRYRWKDVKIEFREIGWEGVDWIHLAHDRDQWGAVVNTVINFRIP
jgi:hypothetical protein